MSQHTVDINRIGSFRKVQIWLAYPAYLPMLRLKCTKNGPT